ncbi:MAG: flagellar assembly protein FliH, partial [Caulobacteraceae bacterium]
MTSSAPRKFMFETEFDDAGAISWQAPRPKLTYTPEEVEQIRAQAYAEGERSVAAQAEEAYAQALQQIAV